MPPFMLLTPLVPFLAMLPLAVAAMYIANRYFRSREGGSQMKEELEALREEIAALREAQVEMHERVDFSERLLSQLREGRRELPKS